MRDRNARQHAAIFRRRRRVAGLVLLGLFGLFLAASMAAAEYTSRTRFCDSCHEMTPYYASWRASAHAARAECADCHLRHGPVGFLATKLSSLREVYVHFAGLEKKPLTVTRAIPNDNCTACHERLNDPAILASSTFSHKQHTQTCLICHARLTHRGVDSTYRPPRSAVEPSSMAACLTCHDGRQATKTCSACHQAKHAAMGPCDRCHTRTDWKPTRFEHPLALTGAHLALPCARCHPKDSKLGLIPGTDLGRTGETCESCHAGPHAGRGSCDRCHGTADWKTSSFKHPVALVGAHKRVACERCHPADSNGGLIPGTKLGKPNGTDCASCHGDEHGGLKDCARCHTPNGWSAARFSHPPAGEHSPTSMACTLCHPSGFGSSYCSCHGGNAPSGD